VDLRKEFEKLNGGGVVLEAEKLFNREESVLQVIQWFKRENKDLKLVDNNAIAAKMENKM
jgi:hypothetical protein